MAHELGFHHSFKLFAFFGGNRSIEFLFNYLNNFILAAFVKNIYKSILVNLVNTINSENDANDNNY